MNEIMHLKDLCEKDSTVYTTSSLEINHKQEQKCKNLI